MKQMSSYPVRISRSADIRKTLSATAGIYRKAVDFFISVCMEEWDTISAGKGQTGKVNAVEAFTIKTSKRKTVPYDFGKDFYKFPSYLRRAAIAQAVGKVSSYKSNLKNWEASEPRTRGLKKTQRLLLLQSFRNSHLILNASFVLRTKAMAEE